MNPDLICPALGVCSTSFNTDPPIDELDDETKQMLKDLPNMARVSKYAT